MNIAVNTRLLLPDRLEGIGWFTFETLKRITRQHPEHTFYFIFDRTFDKQFIFSDNVIPVVAGPQARHPVLFYIWFEQVIPPLLKKIRANLFLSPDGYGSLKTNIPSLLVIHDLNFLHYPKDLPWIISTYYNYFFPKFAHKASRIATVSDFSKNDLQKSYGIPPEKIDVVYNGINEIYSPVPDYLKLQTKKKYSQDCDYFVFIGALLPRKNLKNLFLAYDMFRKKLPTKNIKLLIVGTKKWWTKDLEEVYRKMTYKNDIIFTGRLDIHELRLVLGTSLALTYVSYFEGFGIPIIEAFACGVPVITSDITSMPEVAGDAALLVNPFKPESIAEALDKIATDEKLRSNLIIKGNIRKNNFSWDKTAALLWSSIEKILKQ